MKSCDGILRYNVEGPRKSSFKIIKSEEGKQFECIKCQKVFSEKRAFHVHNRVHREKKFRCDQCGKLFAIKSNLEGHAKRCKREFIQRNKIKVENEKEQKEKKCGKCGRMFALRSSVDRHISKCDGVLRIPNYNVLDTDQGRRFQCKNCPEIFSDTETFHSHFRKHREKKLKCDKCSKMFLHKSRLDQHVKNCDGVLRTRTVSEKLVNYKILDTAEGKRFQCNICQEIILKRSRFYMHYLKRHREKEFQCEKCFKSFPVQSLLNIHVKKCDGTSKLTDIKPTYKVVIDWNGSKKYQCEFCGKEFGDLDNFHQHFCQYQKTMQNKNKDVVYKEIQGKDEKKTYQCLKCVEVFESNGLILQHFYVVHREKKHKCDKCNKSFPFLFKLKKHLKICTKPKVVEREKTENESNEDQIITEESLPTEMQNTPSENVDINPDQNEVDSEFKAEYIPECVKTDDTEEGQNEVDPLSVDANNYEDKSSDQGLDTFITDH